MRRLLLAIAVVFVALPAPAFAATVRVQITGAGAVKGTGIDCERDAAGVYVDLAKCTGPAPNALTATPADGFAFDHWIGCADPCTSAADDVTAVFRDAVNPTITITSPTAGPIRGTLQPTVVAQDNIKVSSVDYEIADRTGTITPFASSISTRALPDGPATLTAIAHDTSGNTGTDTVAVTIDNTAPTLTVTGPNGTTYGAAATETWTIATDAASVLCSVAAQGQSPSFGPCTSPTSHSVSGLGSGTYTFAVRATDGAGNQTTSTSTFAVDAVAPETTIAAGPAEGSTSIGNSASFAFASSEASSTFACRLHPAASAPPAFAPCSPAYSVAGLAPGSYVLEVVATDAAGNPDPTPARRAFAMAAAPTPTPAPTPSPAPKPRPTAPMTLSRRFAVHGDRTRITRLRASRLATGSVVRITCRGRGCRFGHRTIRARHGRADLATPFARHPLTAGARITLKLTAPGHKGRTVTITIRRGRQPKLTS